MDLTKLAGAAGLLFVSILSSTRTSNGLLIRNFRIVKIEYRLEFVFSLTNGHIDMLITHAL